MRGGRGTRFLEQLVGLGFAETPEIELYLVRRLLLAATLNHA